MRDWEKIMQIEKEIDRSLNLFFSSSDKLKNEKFLANASIEVINKEKEKLKDSEILLNILEKQSLFLLNL